VLAPILDDRSSREGLLDRGGATRPTPCAIFSKGKIGQMWRAAKSAFLLSLAIGISIGRGR